MMVNIFTLRCLCWLFKLKVETYSFTWPIYQTYQCNASKMYFVNKKCTTLNNDHSLFRRNKVCSLQFLIHLLDTYIGLLNSTLYIYIYIYITDKPTILHELYYLYSGTFYL